MRSSRVGAEAARVELTAESVDAPYQIAMPMAGVQKRVETMLTMTGAQNFLEIHADEAAAIKSFGA